VRQYPAALTLVLALAGCHTARTTTPEVVYVTTEKLVPVPAALTRPCPAQRVQTRTVEAVVAAYNANVVAQDDCDARMKQIRGLGK
jgi:hypothetical protein